MTGQRIMMDLRRQIYEHLQRLHVAYFDRNPVGRLITRVTTDVDAVNELFTSGVVTVFGDLFTLIGIMGVMLALDWRLALVTFAVIPLFFLVTNWFRRGSRQSFREVRKWVARINAFLQENLGGMSVVQLFRREERNVGCLRRDQPPARGRQPALDLLLRGVLPGHRRPGRGGHRPHPSLWRRPGAPRRRSPWACSSPSSSIRSGSGGRSPTSPRSSTSCRRPWPPRSGSSPCSTRRSWWPPRPRPARCPRCAARCGFERVWFSYAPGEPEWVLQDIDFAVEPGKSVALVGAHRRGQDLDHQPARRASTTSSRAGSPSTAWTCATSTPRQLRSALALVLQDVHLFSGTIESNIRLGSDIPDERVRAAARAVHAHRFIEALPRRLRGGGEGARRQPVRRPEAAPLLRARPGPRSRAC